MNGRTGEKMLVATVATATTITVVTAGRAFGSTVVAAGADGDGLYIIGNVNAEGASARNVNSTEANEETNYTQIFRTSMSFTRSSGYTKTYGGNDKVVERAVKATEHALDIERTFIWGEKKATTSGGQPMRATGGLVEFLEAGNSFVQNQGGLLTESDFDSFLQEGFSYGGNTTKYFMCGGIVLQAISSFAKGKLTTKMGEKSYGMSISEYETPFGRINIVQNPLLKEDYAGYGFLLDLNSFKYRYLTESDTKLKLNIQAPDADGQLDEYLTEAGLERKLAANNALLKGVTA